MKLIDAIGLLLGTFAALVVLVALSVSLLSTPETSIKVLVAVWLWSLPVLGIGALLGWLAARAVCLATASKGQTS